MSTFCLVHGSTQSPRGWDLLTDHLEALGHQCICVDLPVDRPDWGAREYAATIGAVISNASGRVSVVAHSASGLFLPFVPGYADVNKLVYLAAVIPFQGTSFLSQFRADPEMYHAGFAGKDPTADEAVAHQYLFHDREAETARWASSTLRRMFAKQAIVEECPLENWPDVATTYISCTEDRTINTAWWEKAARERLGVEPLRIAAGHCPHVSKPDQLAAILVGDMNDGDGAATTGR